jgi:endonuclease/exonuclease/phosphatase family metal-dependent hydrolase
MAPRVLKAVTLNVWNRSGMWPERLRLITRELAELAPDVYGNGLVMGNAILSRFPIIASSSEPLPHAGTGEPRSLGYARLRTEWGELPVFVTHFNWRFEHGFARLAQAVHVAARGGPGTTYDPRNDYARTNREPARRIDYIFVRGPDEKLRGEPLRTKIVFNEPQEGPEGLVWPSDHFGVYSEIAVEPRSL